ncbi:MAG: hypothetical protein AB8B36_12505, partial [Prochlorococcus sp.]
MRVIVISAPKRSGHHAFISTLLIRNKCPVFFINNPPVRAGDWLDCQYISKRMNLRLQYNMTFMEQYPAPDSLPVSEVIYTCSMIPEREDFIRAIMEMQDCVLVVNFEDILPDHKRIARYLRFLSRDFANIKSTFLLFMRDPYNLLASRLARTKFYELRESTMVSIIKENDNDGIPKSIENIMDVVRDFLGFSLSNKHPNELCILDYASWLYDTPYRASYEQKIDLKLGEPTSSTSMHGKGSSFHSNVNETDHHSLIHRFKQFENTYPYSFIVDRLKLDIDRYYKEICSEAVPLGFLNSTGS